MVTNDHSEATSEPMPAVSRQIKIHLALDYEKNYFEAIGDKELEKKVLALHLIRFIKKSRLSILAGMS